ncbi:MAG: aldo/keto reductase [Proteobacteria bacterium]|nr:aldo/keto reductase [Pseudomonadota bacterium]
MNSVRLGKTGLEVSELGFGGIPIIRVEAEEAAGIIRHCFDRGVTFFDTANMYGDSEKKLGQALGPVRDRVVLATKTLARDAETAARHIDKSLRDLQTDRLDLFQFHNLSKRQDLDAILAPNGAMEAVRRAVEAGKIAHVGFSAHDPATALEACRTGLFATLQFPFNFIEYDAASELFPAAREQDMGLIGMKPLGGGLLDRADLCFGFLRRHSDLVPIPGIESLREADEIIDLYESPRPLSRADMDEIEALRASLGKRFCHRCGYCLPCDNGVRIVEIMGFRSMSRRLDPKMALLMTREAIATVDECTECGECLERCPYSLPIPELIRENQAAFQEFAARHG